MDLDMDEEETFELVGPGQENPDKGRILSTSPIGQGLIGRKKGETVEIPVPRGTIRFKVLEISAGACDDRSVLEIIPAHDLHHSRTAHSLPPDADFGCGAGFSRA